MDDGDGGAGQFFGLLEERALCSSNDSWLRSGTAPAGAPLSDQQQGKEGDGQRDAAGHIDAQHASCAGGPGGRSIAPRSTREPSYYDEFDPLSGQTSAVVCLCVAVSHVIAVSCPCHLCVHTISVFMPSLCPWHPCVLAIPVSMPHEHTRAWRECTRAWRECTRA